MAEEELELLKRVQQRLSAIKLEVQGLAGPAGLEAPESQAPPPQSPPDVPARPPAPKPRRADRRPPAAAADPAAGQRVRAASWIVAAAILALGGLWLLWIFLRLFKVVR